MIATPQIETRNRSGLSKPFSLLCAVTSLFVTGCSATSMTPAHHLDLGDVTVDFGIVEPGAILAPKVSVGATVGAGVGDVSLQVATSFVTARATVAPRIYLSDFGEIKIEGTYWAQLGSERLFPLRSFIIAPRVGFSIQNDEGWFGGVQNATYIPIETADVSDRVATSDTTSLLGGYIGYGWREGRWAYQVEVSGSPIPLASGDGSLELYLVSTWAIGFSVHYWVGRPQKPSVPWWREN